MNVQGKTKQIYWTFVAEIQLSSFIQIWAAWPVPPSLDPRWSSGLRARPGRMIQFEFGSRLFVHFKITARAKRSCVQLSSPALKKFIHSDHFVWAARGDSVRPLRSWSLCRPIGGVVSRTSWGPGSEQDLDIITPGQHTQAIQTICNPALCWDPAPDNTVYFRSGPRLQSVVLCKEI